MDRIKKIIVESLKSKFKKKCNCGGDCCSTKNNALVLNENVVSKTILSEGLKHHMDNNKPLTENLYRKGSRDYFDLIAEARSLYSRGILEFTNKDDITLLTETNLGHFGIFEGKKVPLDYPMKLNEGTYENENHIAIFSDNQGNNADVYKNSDGSFYILVSGEMDYDMDAKDAKEAGQKLKRDGFINLVAGNELTEGYDAYDEISQSEFEMDYEQLGPNEQEWVRDEYDNQPSGRDSLEENTSTVSKSRARSSLKQIEKGKRDDGMGKFDAKVFAVKDDKETELKTLSDLDKHSTGYKYLLKENKLLKQDALSPAEYQKAKKLKGFDPKNYMWDKKQELHLIRKMSEGKLTEYTSEYDTKTAKRNMFAASYKQTRRY